MAIPNRDSVLKWAEASLFEKFLGCLVKISYLCLL